MMTNGQWKKYKAKKHNEQYVANKKAKAQAEEDHKHPVRAVRRKAGAKVRAMLGIGTGIAVSSGV